MRILVACPSARVKEYSLGRWAAATEGHDRLMVTEEMDYIPVIEAHGVPALYFAPPPAPDRDCFRHVMCSDRFNAAWRKILEHAVEKEYSHVLSLEGDVVPPRGVDIVALMGSQWDGSVDFLVHLYPYRPSYNRPGLKCYEMGCTMAATETWVKALESLPPTAVLYWAVYQTKETNPHYHFTNKRIDIVDLRHLEQ